MLEELEKFCVKFLAANLDETSVLTALDRCLKYEISSKLLENCQHYIQKRTRYFLKQWESLSVSYDCLIFLLEQEELNALEVDLFEFVRTFPGFYPFCFTLSHFPLQKLFAFAILCNIFKNSTQKILQSKILSNIFEQKILHVQVFNWAKKACISANCLPTPENIREKMGTCALKLIRFGEMDEDDFCSVVGCVL